jgi:long-chain acyl-CoA synthetase
VTLSPTEALQGRKLFFIGGTGFLGKVALSMLLHRFPNLGRVYLAVRASAARESEARFWDSIVPAPPFDPLRERYGGALTDFLREKVRVVRADVAESNLGLSEDQARSVASDVDVVINSAGRVTFNPALDAALRTNVLGVRNVIAFAKRMRRPALVHTSTCFAVGNRSGTVSEGEPVIGYFPRRAELPGVEFSAERDIADCERLVTRAREEAQDAVAAAQFVERARRRLADEGRDPDDAAALAREVARERKAWLYARLTAVGAERAAWWGWPNTYTYTKSLGEQLVAAEAGLVRAIVRPSIIESAMAYPFPGWNEGFTTTAPIILIALNGQQQIPANERLLLDVTPVDAVAAVVLAVAAEACVREPRLVYQAATGDVSPLPMRRVVELTGLYKRSQRRTPGAGLRLVDDLRARMEPRPVSAERFERASIPMVNAAARKMSSLLDRLQPAWGGGQLADAIDRVKKRVDQVEQVTREAAGVFAMFRPFTVDNAYVFRADNVRALVADTRPEERPLLPWEPERIDWYDYWLRIHVPGLERWIFPTLDAELRGMRKEERAYTYRDLLELFDTATKRYARRVAMRIERGGASERYTYAEVHEVATRAAACLAAEGVRPGDRVLLVSQNAPEWGMCYFGVLKAGATCVPVDPDALTGEVAALARASGAVGVIVSRRVADARPDLESNLREAAGDRVRLWRIDEFLALADPETERRRVALLPDRVPAHALASLIFTSGTTGRPKGVMLSHRNLTSMVSMLSSAFDLSSRDGTVSVLPLHHTFELSAGLLTPLSRGAQITYLPEVNRDEVLRALERGRVTAIVGVPALWESLHRRIESGLRERGRWAARAADALIGANRWLRDHTPLNVGPLLFRPVHRGLGGHLRYVISGGSALSPAIKRDLHGLGFTVLEGYGLTEASPVLTVARPGDRFVAGGVGRALPGVELRIAGADASGIGEVVARGPNVMLGYYGDEEATGAALRDRWLYTGDVGRLGEDGTLYLVGRSKDVIIDGSGRNVYPEDVESLYGGAPLIKEICVVGLRDGPGEQLACVVVPDYAHDLSLSRDGVRRAIEAHFHDVSAQLPYYRRAR